MSRVPEITPHALTASFKADAVTATALLLIWRSLRQTVRETIACE
jgi:hypothetical protein